MNSDDVALAVVVAVVALVAIFAWLISTASL